MNKYKVEGRIRYDHKFEVHVEASSEDAAVRKAERIVYADLKITVNDVIDDEVYVEKIK